MREKKTWRKARLVFGVLLNPFEAGNSLCNPGDTVFHLLSHENKCVKLYRMN